MLCVCVGVCVYVCGEDLCVTQNTIYMKNWQHWSVYFKLLNFFLYKIYINRYITVKAIIFSLCFISHRKLPIVE